MTHIQIKVAGMRFLARPGGRGRAEVMREVRSILPLKTELILARRSGEACWIPFGDLDLDLGYENHTNHPAPGQLLIYPGGISETEILFPCGATVFSSKVGQLAGNHFATVYEGNERLHELGELVLWKGAQEITFTKQR